MKWIFSLLIYVISLSIHAEELPQCELRGFTTHNSTGDDLLHSVPGMQRQKRNLVASEPINYKNGLITAKVDEALVIAEFRPIVLVPQSDFEYKANILTASKMFAKGHYQESYLKYISPSGQSYDVLVYKNGYHIFVGEDGKPCNKVAYLDRSDSSSVLVMHKYRTIPDGGRFERKIAEKSSETIGIRIIYLGLEKGAMKFQETRVENGKILSSATHSFDQFAKSIEIADIVIEVAKATTTEISVKYEIFD